MTFNLSASAGRTRPMALAARSRTAASRDWVSARMRVAESSFTKMTLVSKAPSNCCAQAGRETSTSAAARRTAGGHCGQRPSRAGATASPPTSPAPRTASSSTGSGFAAPTALSKALRASSVRNLRTVLIACTRSSAEARESLTKASTAWIAAVLPQSTPKRKPRSRTSRFPASLSRANRAVVSPAGGVALPA